MVESAMNTTWAAALDDAPRPANLKASVSPPHETVKNSGLIPSPSSPSFPRPFRRSREGGDPGLV